MAMRRAASSLARYSVSAFVSEARLRSSSKEIRSRSSWRFWASRISGAAYAAWVENARLSRMKGYLSHSPLAPANTFSEIQMTTRRVCQKRNFPVPSNRARRSENLPNVSGSMPRDSRRLLRGWSSRRLVRTSGTSGLLQAVGRPGVRRHVAETEFPPVVGQQMIQHVIDGHRPEQMLLVVDHRRAHQVVGREEARDLGQTGVGGHACHVLVDRAGDEVERRLPQQTLGVDAAEIAPGRGGLWRGASEKPQFTTRGATGG